MSMISIFISFAHLTDNPLYHERDRLLDQNLPAIFRSFFIISWERRIVLRNHNC